MGDALGHLPEHGWRNAGHSLAFHHQLDSCYRVSPALVALILVRTLRRDLMRYNRIPTDEEKAEEQEESGWKLVHGDVFRYTEPNLFSVLIGSGVQIFWIAFSTIVFKTWFLSPANRGCMVTGFIVLFVLMGSVGGFFRPVFTRRLTESVTNAPRC